MDNDRKVLLMKGFNRLSGEKQAEIFGMVKALTYAQLAEDMALTLINTITNTQCGDGKGNLTRKNS